MHAFYWANWHGVRAAFWLGGGIAIEGQEHVPADGPLIIASNHASVLDPPVLAVSVTRELHFMARQSLFDPPVFGTWIKGLNAFPVDRDGDSRAALRTFGELLGKGAAVIMFPEGTRTRTGKLAELKPGVGMIAARNGATVLPAYVWGTYQAWPRNQKWPRRHRYKVYFAPPIFVPAGLTGRERKEAAERVRTACFDALHTLEARAWEGEEPPAPLLPDASSPAETNAAIDADTGGGEANA